MSIQSPPVVISGRRGGDLAVEIAAKLQSSLTPTQVIDFSDGNLYVQIQGEVRDREVVIVQTLAGPQVHSDLMELAFLIDSARGALAKRITAVIPYFSYAKADKHDHGGDALRARVVARLLESSGLDRVIMLDLHSSSIPGFFNIPVIELKARELFCQHIKTQWDFDPAQTVVVSPDSGFAKNAWEYAMLLGTDMAVADKYRSDHSEKPHFHQLIGDVTGKRAIIVDDFSTSGGTLIEAARFLLENGASDVRAAISHLLLSGGAAEKIAASPLQKILTTNSIPWLKPGDKLEVIGLSEILAQNI